MRHVLSLVLALILAPVVYLAAGVSAAKFDESLSTGTLDLTAAGLGLLAAFVAGALYAVLVMTRLSPLGPALAGLLYLAVTVWATLDAERVQRLLPDAVIGIDGVLSLPIPAGTALLSVPLLATVLSPRRWRRTAEGGPGGYSAAPEYPPPPDSAAPAYGPLPTYEPVVYTPPSSPTSVTATLPDLPRQGP